MPLIFRYAPFIHQAEQVAIRANVVEPVIVNAEVAHMLSHIVHRFRHGIVEKFILRGCVVLKNR